MMYVGVSLPWDDESRQQTAMADRFLRFPPKQCTPCLLQHHSMVAVLLAQVERLELKLHWLLCASRLAGVSWSVHAPSDGTRRWPLSPGGWSRRT
jgi:hypothetical protein